MKRERACWEGEAPPEPPLKSHESARKRLGRSLALPLLLALLVIPGAWGEEARPLVRVGSKLDTESVTLGELASALIRRTGADVQFRKQLGGTRVVFEALAAGEIGVYPEYTGTISEEILAGSGVKTEDEIRRALADRGIRMTRPLGFNNTYAIGMREEIAEKLGIRKISDLRAHPELKLAFSNEFMNRADGWPGLAAKYQLPQRSVGGMEHTLAYQALRSGAIDGTDLYSTDAEIKAFNLRVLEDDLHYFPDYRPVFLYRADVLTRAPNLATALAQLEGKITPEAMVAMNARSKLDKVPNDRIAADFLRDTLGITTATTGASHASHARTFWRDLGQRTLEHLWLVAVSLTASILVGLPLGIIAAKFPRTGSAILGTVAVIYTIPALALLVFFIPLLGIGPVPAIVALFLYSLLPIVRNTHAGLTGIPGPLRESALAMGLPPFPRLWRIELPLAGGPILAGVKTAAVICVGTATLGALISAGGYGQPILTGITLYDVPLILQGAIPAAVMALAVQGVFELLQRRVARPL
jgi:osmoprotectant transport system permease protein